MKKQTVYKILKVAIPALVLSLCAIPGSYVMRFMAAPDSGVDAYLVPTCYYDMTIWGYADIGPMLCVVLTALTLILTAVGSFVENERLSRITLYVSIAALTAPALTLFLNSLTWIGWLMIVLLAGEVFLLLKSAMEIEDKHRK